MLNDRKSNNSDALFDLYKGTIAKLEAIKAISPILLQDAKSNNDFKSVSTQKLIDGLFNQLPLSSVTMFNMRKKQTELKSTHSSQITGLDLATGIDYVTHLCHQIKKDCKEIKSEFNVLSKIKDDALTMHEVFSPGMMIKSYDKKYVEYKDEQFSFNPPDAIIIMGNNDLAQVKYIASIYALLKTKPDIYVSGYGGHGTVPGKIFGLTEAETIAQCLIENGVPKFNIICEMDAVDTGKNVQKTDIMMLIQYAIKEKSDLITRRLLNANQIQLILSLKTKLQKRTISAIEQDNLISILNPIKKYLMDNKKPLYKNILISGTPAGLLRQYLTYKHQTTLPWDTISCANPGKNNLISNYYNSLSNASINLLYTLREVASYLDYMVNSNFLPNEYIGNEEKLKKIIPLFISYYNLLTKQNVNAADFSINYFNFINFKIENKGTEAERIKLALKINNVLLPMATYFRLMFMEVENRWMKKISSTLFTSAEQSPKVDPQSIFNRSNIDPICKYS